MKKLGEFFFLLLLTFVGLPVAVFLHVAPTLIEAAAEFWVAARFEFGSCVQMWQDWYESLKNE